MEEDRVQTRRNQFKATTDAEEIRRKREDEEVQIRKKEKAELLQQKRNKVASSTEAQQEGSSSITPGVTNKFSMGLPDTQNQFNILEDLNTLLPKLSAGVFNDNDPKAQFDAVAIVRKLLSKEDEPPIELVVQAELTPKLVSK